MFNSIKIPIKLFSKPFRIVKEKYAISNRRISQSPVIILGNQKTGTTVIASLLGKATKKNFVIDPVYQIQYKANSVGQLSLQQQLYQDTNTLQAFIENNKQYFSYELIKEPNFTFLSENVRKYFPEAKFIFTNRDPRNNIRSILNRLNIPGNLTKLREHHLQEMNLGWRLLIEGKYPSASGNNYIERLANRWNLAAESYLRNIDNTIYISYEYFLQDKHKAIISLAKQTGLDLKDDISKQLDIQYQPKGNNNMSWQEFFGQENLARINNICSDKIKIFNYDIGV